jgi:hypothetical protein
VTGAGRAARATSLLAAAGAALAVTVPPASGAPSDAAVARQATAAYHDSRVLTEDSAWVQLHDQAGVTCIDHASGGMGIHFVHPSRIGDPAVAVAEPEAVIYEPQDNGDLRLVGLEYVVTRADWEAAGNTAPPRLFGRDFTLVAAGNRYGLPDFYELHAWVWRHNPLGMLEDWNPQVTC